MREAIQKKVGPMCSDCAEKTTGGRCAALSNKNMEICWYRAPAVPGTWVILFACRRVGMDSGTSTRCSEMKPDMQPLCRITSLTRRRWCPSSPCGGLLGHGAGSCGPFVSFEQARDLLPDTSSRPRGGGECGGFGGTWRPCRDCAEGLDFCVRQWCPPVHFVLRSAFRKSRWS